MAVTLQNVSRRMQTFNLAAVALQTAGGEHGYRIVRPVVVQQSKKGKLVAMQKPRLVPSSLTFSAGEMIPNLPHEVLECEEIKAATKPGGVLRVVAQDPITDAPADNDAHPVEGDRP